MKTDYRLIGDGYQNGARELYKKFVSDSAAFRFARNNKYTTIEKDVYGAYMDITDKGESFRGHY